jgi:hypothetical protein
MLKEKKCKNCKEKFIPQRPLQYVCDWECAEDYVFVLRKKKENKERAEAKKSLLTHKDYIKMLQVVFNTYIRLRDKDKGCISCGSPFTTKYDAGHFYSTSAAPSLRFDEANCHGQCVHCNQHLHANLILYWENLPKRIGQSNYEALKERKEKPLKLSIPEIQEKIKYYKQKIKQIK